ncbi:MAG TPA: hypothetical protein VIK89_13895 [Cytophagaceae bacterium]
MAEVIEKEPLLLFKDEQAINKQLSEIERNVVELNNILFEFGKLGLGEIKSLNDFNSLLKDPKSFCDKITLSRLPDKPEIAGLKVSKEKALELVRPDNQNSVVSFIEGKRKELRISEVAEFIDFKKEFHIKPGIKEQIENECSVYVDSQERWEVYETVMDFRNQFNKLKDILSPKKIGLVLKTSFIGTREDNGNVWFDEKKFISLIKSTK